MGGGAQLQRILSTIAFSEYYGFNYYHLGISNIDFLQPEMSKQETIKRWNEILKFDYFDSYLGENNLNKSLASRTTNDYRNFKSIISLNNAYWLLEKKPQLYSLATNKITVLNPIKNDLIIIHYRAPIVEPNHPSFESDSSREYGLEKLERIINYFRGEKSHSNKKILIATTKKHQYFGDLIKSYSEIILDNSPNAFEIFNKMVGSSVLVISKSSFSYVAGLYNNNEVYYIPFWHSPLPNWKNIDKILLKEYIRLRP